MNGFLAVSSMKKLEKRFRKCPICKAETNIEMKDESFFINCKCGLNVTADSEAKLKKYTYEDNGNTRCMLCGDKVEGGYCSCFNRK